MKLALLATIVAAFALPSVAQVAPGEGALFLLSTPGSGLEVLDVQGTGLFTPITGVPIAGGLLDTGVIDPVTGDIWAVGTGATGYSVYRLTMTGSAVTSSSLLADLSGLPMGPGAHQGVSSLAVDRDGNLFASEDSNIWRIDRGTGVVTTWATGLGDIVNGLTIDRVSNTMWSASFGDTFGGSSTVSEIRRYDLDSGPGVGSVILDVMATGTLPVTIGALTHDGAGTLYVAAFGGLFSVDGTTGVATPMPISGIDNTFNSLDFDSSTGLLHTGGGVAGDVIYSVIDPVTLLGTMINDSHDCILFANPLDPICLNGEVHGGVAVHDFMHTTQVFPRVASNSLGYNLEVSANGIPGDLAVIALVEAAGVPLPSPLVLGSYGTCDLGGRSQFAATVPPNFLAGGITSLGFQTLTHDFTTGTTTLGGLELMTLNP